MNWKRPSALQCRNIVFCLRQIFFQIALRVYHDRISNNLHVSTGRILSHPSNTRQRKCCVFVCGMSHRPYAQTAVFDDVYILMASVQGPETKAVSKNEPSLKQ